MEPPKKKARKLVQTQLKPFIVHYRPYTEAQSCATIISKYENPYYYGTLKSRSQDFEALRDWLLLRYSTDVRVPRSTRSASHREGVRLANIILKRMTFMVDFRTIPFNCKLLTCIELMGDSTLHVQLTNEDRGKHGSSCRLFLPYYGHLWTWMQWRHEEEARKQILLGLHARLGQQSSVYRASHHALYERRVFNVILEMSMPRIEHCNGN